jgi:hypothetical protein
MPAPSVIQNLKEDRPISNLKEIATALVGIKPVIEMLTTVLWTGRVIGERPASIIIVAPPGHGKTSILTLIRSNWSAYTDDLTSREFSRLMTEHPHASHIMLSDMTSIFNRKNSTADLTCNILRRAIEEGIDVDSFTGAHGAETRRVGLITAIPPDDMKLRKIAHQLEEGGFASRFIVARFRYSQVTKGKIHEYIRSDAYTKRDHSNGELRFENRRSEVSIPPRIADKINLLAMDIKRDPLGARAHHHLRALVKAAALQNARIAATETDFRTVEEYSEFFTSKGKVL